MRIRLTFEDPLPAYKCWYEVPASCSTIHDLQRAVRKGFSLDQYCKTTRLDLDGFFLLPASTIAGSLKDGDLLQYVSLSTQCVHISDKYNEKQAQPRCIKIIIWSYGFAFGFL